MKKLQAGRGKTQVLIHSMSITTAEEYLHHVVPFWINVEFYYEPELRFTDDEPGCPEYLEIISATVIDSVLFSGVLTHVDINKGGSIMEHISDSQYDDLVTMVIYKVKENTYYNADANRPDPDERIRRELGFGFTYERDGDRS